MAKKLRPKIDKLYKNHAELQKKFPEVLRNYLGNISKACDEVGISRQTYYDWLELDDNFKALMEKSHSEIKERKKDFVISMLYQKISEGDFQAIKYELDRQAQDRGYGNVQQLEIANKDNKPFEVRHNLTKEQIDAIVKGTKELRNGNDK